MPKYRAEINGKEIIAEVTIEVCARIWFSNDYGVIGELVDEPCETQRAAQENAADLLRELGFTRIED